MGLMNSQGDDLDFDIGDFVDYDGEQVLVMNFRMSFDDGNESKKDQVFIECDAGRIWVDLADITSN